MDGLLILLMPMGLTLSPSIYFITSYLLIKTKFILSCKYNHSRMKNAKNFTFSTNDRSTNNHDMYI